MTPAEYRSLTKKGKRKSGTRVQVPGHRNKYHAQACVVDGIRFHSHGEAKRWQELKLLERAGEIGDLHRQKSFPLMVSGEEIGEIVLDFWYLDLGGVRTERVPEDWKGFDNPLSYWKRKHFEAQYGLKIRLTGPASRRRKAA